MKRIKFYLGTGYAGCSHEEIFEFDDDATEEEINDSFEDWKNNRLDCSWCEIVGDEN